MFQLSRLIEQLEDAHKRESKVSEDFEKYKARARMVLKKKSDDATAGLYKRMVSWLLLVDLKPLALLFVRSHD